MSLAVTGPTRAPLQRLHEIGKVLMQFDLDDVVPHVLCLAAEDGLVRCQVLITAAAGPEHPFVWSGAQVAPAALLDAVERARAAYVALSELPLAVRLEQEPGFPIYPLIGLDGEVLGTLALEWACHPDGERVAFIEDFSDLLAIALDRNARALRATRSRDDLLATVSHELKNLLAALRANLELLHRSAALLPDGRERGHLERVRRASDRMGRLVQDLLDAGSMEAQRLSVDPRRLDVPSVVNEALEAASPLAACRALQLRSELEGQVPWVLADGARLQQVFANLLSNAIKFSPPGGAIIVRAERCGEGVTFSVQDSGAGIREEDRPHLFDRYWKGRHVMGDGYGLGLFICQGIVRAHGGRIWAQNLPGGGVAFLFTLPLGERPRTPADA